jgi:hypothetical protein
MLTEICEVCMSDEVKTILVVVISVVVTMLIVCGSVVLLTDYIDIPATPPTPQKANLSPRYNNGPLQYSIEESQLSHRYKVGDTIKASMFNELWDSIRAVRDIPPRCTLVVVIPKCTVVVKSDLKTSPLSRVVEKNIKSDVILERGGRTDIFDLEVFE